MYRPGRLPRPRPVFVIEVDVRQSDVPPSLERSGDPDLCPSDPAAGTPERGEGPRTARPPHPSRPSSRPPLGRLAHDFGLNYMLPEVDQFSDAVDSVVVISGTKTPRRLFASVSLGLRWPWSEDRRLSARPVPTSAKYPASRPRWWVGVLASDASVRSPASGLASTADRRSVPIANKNRLVVSNRFGTDNRSAASAGARLVGALSPQASRSLRVMPSD